VEDFLKGIKVSNARPEKAGAKPGIDPAVMSRNKLITAIQEQRGYVQEEMEGREPKKSVTKTVDGVRQTVDGRLLKWYFKSDDSWHTMIRYGTSALQFEGGDALEGGAEQAGLIKIYDKIAKAVEAGKLDEHIAKARIKAPRGSKSATDDEASDDIEPAPEKSSQTVQPRFKGQARR